jgi:hypothetical protein
LRSCFSTKVAPAAHSDESHDAMLVLYTKRFDVQIEVARTAAILGCWDEA